MEIGYTDEQEALRRELRDYYSALLTPRSKRSWPTATASGPTCAGS